MVTFLHSLLWYGNKPSPNYAINIIILYTLNTKIVVRSQPQMSSLRK